MKGPDVQRLATAMSTVGPRDRVPVRRAALSGLRAARALVGERMPSRARRSPVSRLRILAHDLLVPGPQAAATLRREIVRERVYDRFAPEAPFRRIVDCGANVGAATSFFLQTHPRSHVTCFEPDPISFGYLRTNVERNSLGERVHLVNAAVSDRQGSQDFFAARSDEAYSLRMSLDPARLDGDTEIVRVETVRLATYLEGGVDLLKLDVEGAEFAVVADLARTGALERVSNLIIEVHHYPHRRDRLGEFLRTLEAYGYSLVLLSGAIRGTGLGACQDILVTGSRFSRTF